MIKGAAIVSILALALAGCFNPDTPNKYVCDESKAPDCPDGYTFKGKICVDDNVKPDAGDAGPGDLTPDKTTPDKKVADQKVADQKVADQKVADQKAADQKAADQKAADQKAPADTGAKDLVTPDKANGLDAAKGASLSKEVQPIFTASCANGYCHAGASASSSLDLSKGKAWSNLVGVASKQCTKLMRVKASDPASSYLVQKLEGSGSCFSGGQMPKGGTPLSKTQISTIKAWITAGAKNN